jgi:hypothetical protein
VLLGPLRAVAVRLWVRRAERGPFDFVYDALPAERDFVTRTYPLAAIPLAFLLLGAESGSARGEGLFSLLLFTPAAYLPLLLTHVPATATPAARWLLDAAPLDPAHESAGARKAIAVRFLTPLYLALGVLVWLRGDLGLALRLTPVAAAVALVVLRLTWTSFVRTPPLSTLPGELGTAWDDSSSSGMITVAIASTLLAVLAWRMIPGPAWSLALLGLTLLFEQLPSRPRSPEPQAQP